MYSTTIQNKVNTMFDDLKKRASTIVLESSTAKEVADKVTRLVSSELSTRSKSILSDMIFDLTDALMESEDFKDISRQNRFTEINLRQEILNKYQFTPTGIVDYKEASRELNALMVGGVTFVVGGVVEIGYVLISGLKLSTLVPIPISVLIAASIGAALADYFAVEPQRGKKKMTETIDTYLDQTQKQLLEWFDQVENYFYERVDEIKLTI